MRAPVPATLVLTASPALDTARAPGPGRESRPDSTGRPGLPPALRSGRGPAAHRPPPAPQAALGRAGSAPRHRPPRRAPRAAAPLAAPGGTAGPGGGGGTTGHRGTHIGTHGHAGTRTPGTAGPAPRVATATGGRRGCQGNLMRLRSRKTDSAEVCHAADPHAGRA